MIMETNLGINEKINVRSNMNYKDRRSNAQLQRSYKIALGYINQNLKGLSLHFAIMPKYTQNQLLVNSNFQQSYK